jgi:hypothetical protein
MRRANRLIFTPLREEFATWLGEANSDDQREILENVLGHIEGLGREFAKRVEDSEVQLASLRAAH